MSGIFARIVALIGATTILWRRLQGAAQQPAWGSAPVVPAAKPQGSLPTLKMPTAQGWSDGQMPVAASGLKVNAFATGLQHPRWIHVLPDGVVLVAEAQQVPEPVRSVFGYAMQATMRRADALGVSAASGMVVSKVAKTTMPVGRNRKPSRPPQEPGLPCQP